MADKNKIIKDAQKFLAKGQVDKAIEEYNKILARAPGDTAVLNTVGDLYLKKNDKNNAIESFKKAADQFAKGGFTLKAIALYKKVLNIKSDQVDVLLMMGKLNAERSMLGSANEYYLSAASYFTKQGMKSKALDVYKTLCNLNPDNRTLAQTLAELYIAEGMDSEGVSKYIELAEKTITGGSYDDAREYLTKAAKKGSGRYDYIRASAKLDLKQNRLPEAIEKLERAREIDHADMTVAELLGEAYHRSGNYEESEAIFTRLSERDPENRVYRNKLMELALKTADFDSAWKQCVNMVQDHLYKSEYEKAETLLKGFLEQKPDGLEAMQLLSDVYTKTGREKEISAVHLKMADIYTERGDTEKAWNIYVKLSEKDPGNEEIKTRMARLGQLGQASPPVLEAHPPAPSSPDMEPPSVPDMERPSIPDMEPPSVPETEQPSVPEMEPPSPQMDKAASAETSAPGMVAPPGAEEAEVRDAADEDAAAEFPPLELPDEPEGPAGVPLGASLTGEAAGADEDQPDEELDARENVYELPDLDIGDLDDLEIFDTSGRDETSSGVSSAAETSAPASGAAPPETSEDAPGAAAGEEDLGPEDEEEPATVAERLGQVDVYISYGFIPMAQSAIDELIGLEPDNPDVVARQINICKANDDTAGMVASSIRLADIYAEKGLAGEAAEILDRARELDPGNEELANRLGAPEAPAPEPEEEAPPEAEEAAAQEAPEEALEEAPAGKAAAPSGLSSESVEFIEKTAEADFYAQQGLVSEARLIYEELMAAAPDNEELRSKYENCDRVWEIPETTESPAVPAAPEARGAVSGSGGPDEGPTAAAEGPRDEFDEAFREFEQEEEPGAGFEPAFDDSDFFDLASELKDELDEPALSEPDRPSSPFRDKFLDNAFQEFKKGVEDQLSKEDYETHYNLGIAYKEMGMLDEALDEFRLASKDESRSFDCASMLGLCCLEKGDFEQAIDHFEAGLDIEGREAEEYMGLSYYMAAAHEEAGDIESAYRVYRMLSEKDKGFRDVGQRLGKLEKELKKAGVSPEELMQREADKGGKPKKPAKKSRVSYI